jgi:hypothetical protein
MSQLLHGQLAKSILRKTEEEDDTQSIAI